MYTITIKEYKYGSLNNTEVREFEDNESLNQDFTELKDCIESDTEYLNELQERCDENVTKWSIDVKTSTGLAVKGLVDL